MKDNPIRTTIKYAYSTIITIIAACAMRQSAYALIGLIELGMIFSLTNALCARWKRGGVLLNSALMFLYNAQMMVLIQARSFTVLIMLTNLDSIKALSGKLVQYGLAALSVIAFSLLPIRPIKALGARKSLALLSCLAAAECAAVLHWGVDVSPLGHIGLLIEECRGHQAMQRAIRSDVDETAGFYRERVGQYVLRDAQLSAQPNIVVIFTEGFSQRIIDDERDITPNVRALQEKSLTFTNYYNHTAATYRGLSGQLYSGYQLNEQDSNSLISLQSLLREQGYETYFINTEPDNADFTRFLREMDFDHVLSAAPGRQMDDSASLTDREAYDLLWSIMDSASNDKPYLICMYTFGTHVSFDSPDEKFGDGTSNVLNRFHNMDAQFGRFMERFEDSDATSDTLLVFTTDHASYQDADAADAFSYPLSYGFINEIPLCFYYKGMEPQRIDVGGRNSLCLTPTLLDYLDISDENYFLGTSLFAPEGDEAINILSYTTIIPPNFSCTKGATIFGFADDELLTIQPVIERYFSAKLQSPAKEATSYTPDLIDIDIAYIGSNFKAIVADDCSSIDLTYTAHAECDGIFFAVWSDLEGQDDILFYRARSAGDNTWQAVVDLSLHNASGGYTIHIYSEEDGRASTLLGAYSAEVPALPSATAQPAA